jgi:putative membrane protein
LETFAAVATEADSPKVSKPGTLRLFGQYIGISFAESNPMETIKSSDMPLGNLPLEIMTYIGAFLDYLVENGQLKVPMQQTVACKLLPKYTLNWLVKTDANAI